MKVPANIVKVRKTGALWIFVPTENVVCRAEEIDENTVSLQALPINTLMEVHHGLTEGAVWLMNFTRYVRPIELSIETVLIVREAAARGFDIGDMGLGEPNRNPAYMAAAHAIHTLLHEKGPL